MPSGTSLFAPLRHRAFRDLWLAQTISQLGDSLYFIVFMFLAKKTTGSDAFVGFVSAAETLPYLLFGPYAGVLADRIDRKKILLWSDLVSAVVLIGFLALELGLGSPPKWALLVVPFLLSSVRCFFMPAKGAAVPATVPPEDLQAANGLSAFTGTLAPMMGLALSGGVIALLYDQTPTLFVSLTIGLNLLSFLGSAIFVAKLPPLLPDRVTTARPMEDFRDGLRFIKVRRDLRQIIALVTCLRLFVAPFFVCYLAVNEKWFDGKPGTLAWLEFSFFLGMALTAPLAAKLPAPRPAARFAWALFWVGIGVGSFAFAKTVFLFCLFNFLAGLVMPMGDVPINTYLARSVVDGYRGRVNSVLNTIGTGVMPIGAALGGTVVGAIGLEWTFILMASGFVVPAVWLLLDPSFRRIRMPEDDPKPGDRTGDDDPVAPDALPDGRRELPTS